MILSINKLEKNTCYENGTFQNRFHGQVNVIFNTLLAHIESSEFHGIYIRFKLKIAKKVYHFVSKSNKHFLPR